MDAALRVITKVLPGNKVEIEVPEGSIGETIEVIIMLPKQTKAKKRNVLELIESARRLGNFRSIEEIDRDLRAERDSWDD